MTDFFREHKKKQDPHSGAGLIGLPTACLTPG